jgi:hypothetical protein
MDDAPVVHQAAPQFVRDPPPIALRRALAGMPSIAAEQAPTAREEWGNIIASEVVPAALIA